jgi:hypothetical protein
MKVQKLLITPDYAKQLLSANPGNRKVKTDRVLMYANDMQNGRWKSNTGENIKISKTSKVLDGQHRLLALIKTGMSIEFLVISELEDSVFDVIDTGCSRNASDTFKISGVDRSNILPSIISGYDALKKGYISDMHKSVKLTNAQVLEKHNSNTAYWQEVARLTINWYNRFNKILKPSTLGTCYALFNNISPRQSEYFMDQLCSGINIENESIAVLRNALIKDKISIRKMPPKVKLALIIKTWNIFRMNKVAKRIYFDDQNETFPIAI